MSIPVPRYTIGQLVWYVVTDETLQRRPCPDAMWNQVTGALK